LEILRQPGEHTSSELSEKLGCRIQGEDLETIQMLLLEQRNGERLKRQRAGRFIHWWIEKSD